MKTTHFFLFICFFMSTLNISAEDVSKTINLSEAGTLTILLAANEKTSVTNLTVTGNIDARDIACMRDEMIKLKELDISSVTIHAFTGKATRDEAVTYPANEMPEFSFSNVNSWQGKTTLTSIKLPTTLTSIGYGAFAFCSELTGQLTIPNSVISIGGAAFVECSGFTGNLILPNSLTEIAAYTFKDCNGFTGILTIPNSVTSIGQYAFSNCDGFSGLRLPDSVTEIGVAAFESCNGFTGNLTIPNTVTRISEEAFWGCSGFNGKLTIGNSIRSIDDYTFWGCSGFTGDLTIPNSVTKIGQYAFGTTIFREINDPEVNPFSGILTIGSSVTSIDGSAFEGCIITRINSLNPTPPFLSEWAFFGINYDVPVYVPESSITSYKASWTMFSQFHALNITKLNNISNSTVKVYSSQTEIIIDGTSNGEILHIYTENGTLIQHIKSQGERIVFPIQRNRVYIVKTSGKTVKIVQ